MGSKMSRDHPALAVSVFLFCTVFPFSPGLGQTIPADEYARLCEKLISDVPPIDCSQGTEIRMTLGAKDGNGLDTCQEPSLLADTGCRPGSRLLRLTPVKNPADTEIVFLCRSDRTSSQLNSVIGVHHNTRTGATCWYHSFGHGRLSRGARLPPPATAPDPLATPTWDGLNQTGIGSSNCMTCHDSDPYIVTPFLARTADANALPGLRAGEAALDWYNRPYASFFMRRAPGADKLPAWPPAIRMQPASPNACSGCHGYGIYTTVRDYLKNATGDSMAAGALHPTIWMPPTNPFAARKGEFKDLDQSYKDAVAQIRRCQDEVHALDIQAWLAGGTGVRPADVADSFRRCGWHYSSIELAAVSISALEWENNALRGAYRVLNRNRFAARDVRMAIRAENGGGGRIAELIETRSLGANAMAPGTFVVRGQIADQDEIGLSLYVDTLADPDLPDGEFLEVNEDDNKLTAVLRLNDLQVLPPKGATQLLPGTPVRLAFTVRNDGPLPVRGARTDVLVTNAGSPGLSCVHAGWDRLKHDWRPGETRTLEVRIANQCAVQNRTIQIRVEADPDRLIPERAQANNVVVYTYTLPYPPPPPPHPGGPGTLNPTFNVLTQLMRTRTVFLEICQRMRVTPDSNICTGLERLPTVRDPDDIVVPRPMPVPTPFLEQVLEALRVLRVAGDPQFELANARLERALAGEPVDLSPVAALFSMLANADVVADRERGRARVAADGAFTPAPGWSWTAKSVTGDVSLRPSDLVLADFGVSIDSVPFMWIEGPTDRPVATVSVDLSAHGPPAGEQEFRPLAVAMVDGVLLPLESDWNPESGRIHVRVPGSAMGLGFVWAAP